MTAEIITGPSLIVLGLATVVLVFFLRRSLLRTRRGHERDGAAAKCDDFEAAEKGAVRATEMLEVRLHEFAREVEGRIMTRIAVLDRLIVDADREIASLKHLLAATNGEQSDRMLTGEGRRAGASPTVVTDAGALRQPDAVVVLPAAETDHRKEAA